MAMTLERKRGIFTSATRKERNRNCDSVTMTRVRRGLCKYVPKPEEKPCTYVSSYKWRCLNNFAENSENEQKWYILFIFWLGHRRH